MNETLPHAVQRMRAQGYDDQHIAAQIHNWHHSWTPGQVSAVMTPAKPTKPSPKRGSPERFDPPSHSGNFKSTSVGLNPNLYDPNEKVPSLGSAWLNAADAAAGFGTGVRPSTLKRVASDPLGWAAKNRKAFKASGYRSSELTPTGLVAFGATYGGGAAARIAERGAAKGLATSFAAGGARKGEKLAAMRAEHADLREKYEAFIDQFLSKKLTPDELKRQREEINPMRGKYKKQNSGKTKSGRNSGASGWKVQQLPKNVKEEKRLQMEEELHRLAHENPNDPGAKAFLASHARMEELRSLIGQHEEESLGALPAHAPGAVPTPELPDGGSLLEHLRGMDEHSFKQLASKGVVGPEKRGGTDLVDAVVRGEKPAALLGESKSVAKYARSKGLKVRAKRWRDEEHGDSGISYAVAKTQVALDNLERADKLAHHDPLKHTIIGKTLGYSDADVAAYLERNFGNIAAEPFDKPLETAAAQPSSFNVVRHHKEDLQSSIDRPHGAYFQFADEKPQRWPHGYGDETTHIPDATPQNPLHVGKEHRMMSAGEAALAKLRPELRPLLEDSDTEGLVAWAEKHHALSPADLKYIKEDGSFWAIADALGGKFAREAGHDAIVSHMPDKTYGEYVALHKSATAGRAAEHAGPPYPEGTLYHGSPDGELGNIDTYYHTKPWREGPGFYATTSPEKAAKYAAGKTAKGERLAAGAGKINVVKLAKDAKVLDMDAAGDDFWRGIVEHVTGEKVDQKKWEEWARDVSEGDRGLKGASPGILNRARAMHMLTGWAELPHTDAYYALEEALEAKGYQATKHVENGVPVYVIKDANAIEKVASHKAHELLPPEPEVQAASAAIEPAAKAAPLEHPPVEPAPVEPVPVEPVPEPETPAATGDVGAELRPILSGRAGRRALKQMGKYEKLGAKADDPYLGMSAKQAEKAEQALRTEERIARFEKANKHLANKALDPSERVRLWKRDMRGELPKIHWRGFDELSEESVKAMARFAMDEAPNLYGTQRVTVVEALENALNGIVPRPHELKLLTHVFGEDVTKGYVELAKSPLRDAIIGTLNIPRTLMASMDFSAPLRQGLVIGARHPIIAAKNFPAMFKAFGLPFTKRGEAYFQAAGEEIKARPNFGRMLEAKLPLTGLDHGIGQVEEPFLGANVAEKFTGGKRSPVRASDRAYTLFLDKMRADVFDRLIRHAESEGRGIFRGVSATTRDGAKRIDDPKFLHDLGKFIGNASGRGTFDHEALEKAMPLLNIGLFSPRLIASRVQMLNPYVYYKLDPFVRREALASALSTMGAITTVLGLAKLGGAKVEMDWRSSDFGKIRIGNTRVDIAGGFQQYFHLLGELKTGEKKSATTGEITSLRHPKFGQPNTFDVAVEFLRNKAAPVPGAAIDLESGSTSIGEKATPWSEVKRSFIPLIWQDAHDLYKEPIHGMNGIEAALLGYGLGMFGTGMGTYPPPKSKGTSSDPFDRPSAGGGDPFSGSSSGGSDPFDR